MSQAKGLGLVSGGLDSLLALLVLKKQGVHVDAVTFTTPFFGSERAKKAAEVAGVKLLEKDITEEYFEMLGSPAHGYGRLMNPCIDCHALMLKKAWEIKEQKGFDFVFTGEVLGQRPMSQRYDALRLVEKAAGLKGRVLRPLCAKLLKETEPEILGHVDRGRLLDIQGRHRKRQLALAEEFGLDYIPSAAGGCLLTDQEFSARLKDLMEKGPALTRSRALILRLGRHFRLPSGPRLVVGRNHEENERLAELREDETVLRPVNFPGPTALLSPGHNHGDLLVAAAAVAAYSKGEGHARLTVAFAGPGGAGEVDSPRVSKEFLRPFMVRFGKETEPGAGIFAACPGCGSTARMEPKEEGGRWSWLCSACGEEAFRFTEHTGRADG